MGPRASLLVGDFLGAVTVSGAAVRGAAVQRSEAASAEAVAASLAAPQSAPRCARLRFTTELSKGNAGRGLER